MSWSVSAKGNKDDVRATIESQFETQAKTYEGKEEGKDIASARERVMSMLEELDLSAGVPDGEPPRVAQVSAWGSRSSTWGAATCAEFHVNVTRTDP